MSSTVEPTTGEAELIRRLQRFHNDNVVDGVPCGDWHVESNPEHAVQLLRQYVAQETVARERRLREALEEMVQEFGCDTRYAMGEKRQGAVDALSKARAALSSPVAEQKHPDSEPTDLLRYERMQEIHDRIILKDGEMVLQRRPFRWMLNGSAVSNAYESFDVQGVLRDNGWEMVESFNDDLYIVRGARKATP